MAHDDNTPFIQDMTEEEGNNSPQTAPQSEPPRSNAKKKFTDFDEHTRCRIFDLNSLRSTFYERQVAEARKGWRKVRQRYLQASSDTRAEMLFASRLLVSHGISMNIIQHHLHSTPPSMWEEKITTRRKELIDNFAGTDAGKNWIESMRYQDAADPREGWQYTAALLLGEQSKVKAEDIDRFFLMLDEISILTDILHGEGDTYGIQFKPQALMTKVNCDFLQVKKSEREKLMIRLLSLTRTAEKPKEKMMPIRAAIEAGVMPRISYNVFKQTFDPKGAVSKTSYNDYTDPTKCKFFDNAYYKLIAEFRAIGEEPTNDDEH